MRYIEISTHLRMTTHHEVIMFEVKDPEGKWVDIAMIGLVKAIEVRNALSTWSNEKRYRDSRKKPKMPDFNIKNNDE